MKTQLLFDFQNSVVPVDLPQVSGHRESICQLSHSSILYGFFPNRLIYACGLHCRFVPPCSDSTPLNFQNLFRTSLRRTFCLVLIKVHLPFLGNLISLLWMPTQLTSNGGHLILNFMSNRLHFLLTSVVAGTWRTEHLLGVLCCRLNLHLEQAVPRDVSVNLSTAIRPRALNSATAQCPIHTDVRKHADLL